jgi:hypothetical protein
MSVEIDNRRLIKIDRPDRFMRFTLRCFKKKRGCIEQFRHKRLAGKYKPFNKELNYIIDTYVEWGFLDKDEKLLPKKDAGIQPVEISYTITDKGMDALKWRIITPFYPGMMKIITLILMQKARFSQTGLSTQQSKK